MSDTRVYQMPNGRWYWKDFDGHKATTGGFGGEENGFDSRLEAIDGLATHIGFRHAPEHRRTYVLDLPDELLAYQKEHDAIRRALLTKVTK